MPAFALIPVSAFGIQERFRAPLSAGFVLQAVLDIHRQRLASVSLLLLGLHHAFVHTGVLSACTPSPACAAAVVVALHSCLHSWLVLHRMNGSCSLECLDIANRTILAANPMTYHFCCSVVASHQKKRPHMHLPLEPTAQTP